MRHSLLGAVLIAGLVIAATAARSSSEPAYVPVADPSRLQSSELITHVTATDGVSQVITVIDPRERVIAVYDVELASGLITLKSVRNITWDLQWSNFNCGDPKPQDVRNALQQ
jgi:hypothetical protein